MPIPKYNDLFPTVLEFLADGNDYKTRVVKEKISNQLDLTDDERKQLLPSKQETIINNRIGWAITSLKKAGFVESKSWGHINITKFGLEEFNKNPNITEDDLLKIKSYREYKGLDPEEIPPVSTPEEEIEKVYLELKTNLAEELLEYILNMDPFYFEKLVLDLLLKMGYGGFRDNAGFTTSKSNDGGIDGIINEDVLGLGKIAIQAKRYNPSQKIGSQLVQGFAGALVGKGLNKGVFITTSTFTPKALDFVNNQSNLTIVLIDGKKLAELMIEYDLGTSTVDTYHIKKIDSDYFNIGD